MCYKTGQIYLPSTLTAECGSTLVLTRGGRQLRSSNIFGPPSGTGRYGRLPYSIDSRVQVGVDSRSISGGRGSLPQGACPQRARENRDARKFVADGIDPSARRQAERSAAANTFVAVADEWLMTKKRSLSPCTSQRDHDQLHK